MPLLYYYYYDEFDDRLLKSVQYLTFDPNPEKDTNIYLLQEYFFYAN